MSKSIAGDWNRQYSGSDWRQVLVVCVVDLPPLFSIDTAQTFWTKHMPLGLAPEVSGRINGGHILHPSVQSLVRGPNQCTPKVDFGGSKKEVAGELDATSSTTRGPTRAEWLSMFAIALSLTKHRVPTSIWMVFSGYFWRAIGRKFGNCPVDSPAWQAIVSVLPNLSKSFSARLDPAAH